MSEARIPEDAIEAVMNVIWRPQHANEERLGEMHRDAEDAIRAALPHLFADPAAVGRAAKVIVDDMVDMTEEPRGERREEYAREVADKVLRAAGGLDGA